MSAAWNAVMRFEPPLGAHLVTPRRGYSHHGIYVGDGKVVHYAGFSGMLRSAEVEELSIVDFAAGSEIWIKPVPCAKYVGSDAIRRARSRLGEKRYRLLTNNCEHFCSWCLFGQSRSDQVRQCFAHPCRAMNTIMTLLKERLDARSSVRCGFDRDACID
jgi:hypothetical protein